MDTEVATCFLIHVVFFVSLKVFLCTPMDSFSKIAKLFQSFFDLSFSYQKSSDCQREFLGFDLRFIKGHITRSQLPVKCRSKVKVLLRKKSQFGQQKDSMSPLVLLTLHIWFLYLSNYPIFSHFCTLPQAISPMSFPSTLLLSCSRRLSVYRSSSAETLFMWTPCY